MDKTTKREPYVVAGDLLFTELLHRGINLVLGGQGVVGENHLVQGAVIGDDQGDVASNISQIGEGDRGIAIADDLVVGRRHGVVGAA